MKQVNLSLETAKEMYNSNNSSLKKFALENYTEEELTKKEFPKEWGFCYGNYDLPYVINNIENKRSLFALAKLIGLRDLWWKIDNDYVPNFKTTIAPKYVIGNISGLLWLGNIDTVNHIFSFRTAKIRDEFYQTFKDLLEEAKPLL